MNDDEDDEKRMRVDIINWVKVKVVVIKKEDKGGSGDSATHTFNQTRDNNTDFRSYYNCFQNHNYKL